MVAGVAADLVAGRGHLAYQAGKRGGDQSHHEERSVQIELGEQSEDVVRIGDDVARRGAAVSRDVAIRKLVPVLEVDGESVAGRGAHHTPFCDARTTNVPPGWAAVKEGPPEGCGLVGWPL